MFTFSLTFGMLCVIKSTSPIQMATSHRGQDGLTGRNRWRCEILSANSVHHILKFSKNRFNCNRPFLLSSIKRRSGRAQVSPLSRITVPDSFARILIVRVRYGRITAGMKTPLKYLTPGRHSDRAGTSKQCSVARGWHGKFCEAEATTRLNHP